MTVRELVSLAGGAKRVVFRTGETLTLRAASTLTVLRTVEGWEGGRP
ncbi:hypothetical protein [Streptomyces boncukensis]|uniref:Uncharacterized protein n=1 Tax=Streptomyces boncukensis TaxID=2711219 RepID=A0A6G4WS50_9ACTN|nr:hypothetical protein [Streptomyces boncukensis]NGO67457.1 hypothetical protein [Streptomyces boncukensis]